MKRFAVRSGLDNTIVSTHDTSDEAYDVAYADPNSNFWVCDLSRVSPRRSLEGFATYAEYQDALVRAVLG